MIASTRAELLRLAKWPVTWLLAGVWLVLNLSFAYLFTYLSYRSATSDGNDRLAATLLEQVSMDQIPSTLAQGMPLFGGAIVLIFAALATGSGYGWSTWKTVFTNGPRRLTAFGGTMAAIAGFVAALVLATLVLDMAASAIILGLESEPVNWPAAADLAQSAGAGLLILGMYAAFGAALGVVVRSPALSVGLGLVWALVIENLLRGVAELLGPVEAITDVLPGTAAGSLAGALGAAGETAGGGQPSATGTPGVLGILDGGPATAVLLAYAAGFLVLLAILVQRRDV